MIMTASYPLVNWPWPVVHQLPKATAADLGLRKTLAPEGGILLLSKDAHQVHFSMTGNMVGFGG